MVEPSNNLSKSKDPSLSKNPFKSLKDFSRATTFLQEEK